MQSRTRMLSGLILIAALVFGTAAIAAEPPKKNADTHACGPLGAPLIINGHTVCAPVPSSDLQRFATAASLAAYLGRSYADVVNDFARQANPAQTRLRQAAPGSLKIDSEAPIVFADIAASPGQVISRLTVKNDGPLSSRVMIHSGEAHLDFVLAPNQEFDSGELFKAGGTNLAEILVAGRGRKLISGVTQAIAGGVNQCIVFEGSLDACSYCIGENACIPKQCVPLTTKSCFGVWEEAASCGCK
jgi:hypothetical protein